MKVVVLGSGIIGIATAWWLKQAGHEVEVIERHAGPAQETSFANGGQISVSYATPWASPTMPAKLLKWLLDPLGPIVFHPRLDWNQWLWGARFLRECTAARYAHNAKAMVNLSRYSLDTLRVMRADLGLQYHQQSRGILSFYRTRKELELAVSTVGLMQDLGIERRMVSTDEAIALEPALAGARNHVLGADYTQEDESGDVHLFSLALADKARAAGVSFRFNTTVTRLLAQDGAVRGVECINAEGGFETRRGDCYVLALGAFSAPLLRALKLPCPIYPAKGYSATYPLKDASRAPLMSLTDIENKVVMSRLGDRLRVAGTAEINGYERHLNEARCTMLTTLTDTLLPGAIDVDNVSYWAGLRPATPSNVPMIGAARGMANLYLNTGHGTLGWTMGCGSGKALAALIDGQRPDVDFPFM